MSMIHSPVQGIQGNTIQSAVAAGSALAGIVLLSLVFSAGLEGSSLSDLLLLCEEDGFVENLSALAYFCGFVICVWAMVRRRIDLMLAGWALLSFLFLGEETSWFQRIIGYHVPMIEEMNIQHEFNLHNLSDKQGVGWTQVNSLETFLRAMFGSQNLFQMGFITFFAVFPLLSRWQFTMPLQQRVGYCPPTSVMLAVIWGLVALSYVYVALANGEPHKNALVEVRELVFAGAILAYAVLLAGRHRDVSGN